MSRLFTVIYIPRFIVEIYFHYAHLPCVMNTYKYMMHYTSSHIYNMSHSHYTAPIV